MTRSGLFNRKNSFYLLVTKIEVDLHLQMLTEFSNMFLYQRKQVVEMYTWYKQVSSKRRIQKPLYTNTLGGSDGKKSAYNAGDVGSIAGWGRAPGEGNGNLI